MSNTGGISAVLVEGLHDQLDVELSFNPGLNIIYGKNGRGKTTVLHLIANALELDFARFSYLRFRKICLETFDGNRLEINRVDPSGPVVVSLNGEATSFDGSNGSLSEVEITSMRKALGERATYLPAFRSVLERAKGDGNSYYRASERRESDFEEVMDSEYALLRSKIGQGFRAHIEQRQVREEAYTTAQKTLQCRQWFGQFVPVIRYPSVVEVEETLTEEWRQAHLSLTRKEQKLFEETFVKVFRATSGLDVLVDKETNEDLLASISDLLKETDFNLPGNESSIMYEQLLEAARQGANKANESINKSILGLYKKALEDRRNERESAFKRMREFSASVNEFLDNKKLVIGPRSGNVRLRGAVAFETPNGHGYGMAALSSGERQVLTMLFSASRSKISSGVFLVDEPELSLHIDWQRIILRELKKQSNDRQIIACTHSPEVGADYIADTQDFEPKLAREPQGELFDDEDI